MFIFWQLKLGDEFGICFFFLKDVVSHNKKMKTEKMKSEIDQTAGDKLGIKGLSKGKRRKLEAYQHLFYLLQVIKEMCQAPPLPSAMSI